MNPCRRFMPVLVCAVLLAVVTAPAAAQTRRDPASVTLSADLRESPEPGAAVLATVSAGQSVSVLEMRGPQARVEASGIEGWMPAAKLRVGGAAPGSASDDDSGGAGWLRGLSGLLGGGGGSGDSNSAKVPIGVRGLQSEDLAEADPDPGAVERLELWQVSPAQAQAYARDSRLTSVDVAYRQASGAIAEGGDR